MVNQKVHRLNDAAVRTRAETLAAQMTIEEKAHQLVAAFNISNEGYQHLTEESIAAGRLGILNYLTDPKVSNKMQRI